MMARARLPSLIWLQGLMCGTLITLATPLAVLLAALLAPAIGAILADRLPGKPRARAALLFAAAWCIGPVRSFWSSGGDLSAALSQAADAWILARSWLAAGFGWALAELAPLAMRAALELTARIGMKRLETRRDRLREEWGMAPASDSAIR